MTPDPSELRVSDADRERLASEMREHYAAGRLTDDELSQRVQAAYAARTHGDLDAVRGDLPRLPASPVELRAQMVERRRDLQRRLIQQTGGALGAFAICTGIWFATGANGMFWPIWVALVAVVALVRNGWDLYGPAPDLDRVERWVEQHERGRRDRREQRRR